MKRLCESYVKNSEYNPKNEKANNTAREYRLVAQKGKGANGREFLEAFDYMGDVFNRCERNFSLAGKWDELTADVVENF